MRITPGTLRTAVGVAMVAIVACAPGCVQLTQAQIKALETREIDCDFDEAYRAAANGLFALGYTVSHSDKESGILTGNRHDPNTGAKVAAAMFFGVLGLAATEERNEAITFMLSRLEPQTTQLRMKVVVNGKPVVDHNMMTRIWQQIEREAMLESRPSERASPRPTGTPSDEPHGTETPPRADAHSPS